jgi:tRNA threonylcarbamoyladenosine biosynthesis protein TsaB
MRILALDAALARCSAAVVVDDDIVASRRAAPGALPGRGQSAVLPDMAAEVLAEVGLTAADLDMVAVTVGPGSFTGIRAGLALAHGIALAADIPVVGVTVGEALAEALPRLGGRKLWSAVDSRRGRVFLERDVGIEAFALDDLPEPGGAVAIAGDAAVAVAAGLAARGANVMLSDSRLPQIRHVALAAAKRWRGELPARAPLPVYVDPPEAKLPAGGLRPAPHGS